MKDKNLEIKLLLEQRNMLIKSIENKNSLFHKIILAILTSIVTIAVSKELKFGSLNSSLFILFFVQILMLLAIFTAILLCGTNNERYYICAIDNYLFDNYGITCLFYQGNVSTKNTIGIRSKFHIFNTLAAVAVFFAFVWFIVEYDIFKAILKYKWYFVLLIFELLIILGIIVCSIINKLRGSIEYKTCFESLNRNNAITE